MLPFLAVILAGAAGAADVSSSNLPGVFEAACLDGQAKLSASDASAVSFEQLPVTLQKSLGRPASGKIWRLNGAGNAYLYVLDYAPGPGISPKVCGLASDAMDAHSATEALAMRVAGTVERNSARTSQWLNARDGYVATSTSAGSLNVLQISWMSDADRAKTLEQVEQLPH